MQDSHRTLFTCAAEFIDSDHPAVISYARDLAGDEGDPAARARILYDAVRDNIRYDPYRDFLDPQTHRASAVLAAGTGYCVSKAALLAALCRAAGIPARIGLADVRNHLATPRLLAAVGTDIFRYHGYAELWLGGRWVKASPTFNATLCEKLGVAPLPFDGENDALLQDFDGQGRVFMSYLADHGPFFDVPAKFLIAEMPRIYPGLCVPGGLRGATMEQEAGA